MLNSSRSKPLFLQEQSAGGPRCWCVCSPTTAASSGEDYHSCTDPLSEYAEGFNEQMTDDDRWPLLTAAVAVTNCVHLICSGLFRVISAPVIVCVILCSVLADEWHAQRERWRSWRESYTLLSITQCGNHALLPLIWCEREMQTIASQQRGQRRWSCLFPICRTETRLPINWWVRIEPNAPAPDKYIVFGVERRLSHNQLCSLLVEKWVLRNALFRSIITHQAGLPEWLTLRAVGENSFRIEEHVTECQDAASVSELLAESCAHDLRPDLPLWHCKFCHAAAAGVRNGANATKYITGEATLIIFRVHSSLGETESLADAMGTSLFGPEAVREQPLILMLASIALLTLLALSEMLDLCLVTLRALIFAAQAAIERCSSLWW